MTTSICQNPSTAAAITDNRCRGELCCHFIYLDYRIQFIGTSQIINAISEADRLSLRLDLDEHILGIGPVRHWIRIGIIDGWIPGEVGRVHGREDIVRHERGNWHLLRGELAEIQSQFDALGVVEGDLLDAFDNLCRARGSSSACCWCRQRFRRSVCRTLSARIEEEEQVGIPTPGLDRPGQVGGVFAAAHDRPGIGLRIEGGIDAERLPVFDDRGGCPVHGWVGFAHAH